MTQEQWLQAPEKAYNETLGIQEGDSTTFYQSRLELIREVCKNMEKTR